MGKGIKKCLKYLFFFGITIVVLLPFFWTVYASLVSNDLDINTEVMQGGKYSLENFKYILSRGEIFTWLKNRQDMHWQDLSSKEEGQPSCTLQQL